MVKYGRTSTVFPSAKPLQKRKKRAGDFSNLSKAKREKIGAALKKAREERGLTVESIATLNEMSLAQVRRNERGFFGVVQDIVIIKHLVSLGLIAQGVLE